MRLLRPLTAACLSAACTASLFAPLASAQPAAPEPVPAEAAPAEAEPEEPADYYGRAAPATRSGTLPQPLSLKPGLEVFAQYSYRVTEGEDGDSDWFHVFDVPRVHLSLTGETDTVTGRVLVEGVRSGSEGSLIGVGGNSIITRLREAYAGYRGLDWLEVDAGLVPTLAIPELEGTWMLRAVSAVPEEQTGLLSPADVGGKVKLILPKNYGWVGAASFNGEGYTNRELNRGKSAVGAFSVHPLPGGPVAPLAVFASYTSGSTGTGLSRADRATGALLWQGRVVRAGVAATHGWGLDDDGTRRTLLIDVFAHVRPWRGLILGARGWQWNRDTDASDDKLLRITAAAGWEVDRSMQVFLAGTRSMPGDDTQAALPGTDYTEARAVARVVF